ncbi:AIR synthase related protein, partial [Klebsiella pneumoniae]|uniref:AIR synthase related protein n=1 Tax=Klebsiella pneumoniae TaxID=573 RepID=UPI002119B0CA
DGVELATLRLGAYELKEHLEIPYRVVLDEAIELAKHFGGVGATPHSILLALSLPQIDHDWLKAFSQGLYDCCDQFGVSLIGGDTTQSPHLTLSVTALGWVDIGQAIPRSGAKPG